MALFTTTPASEITPMPVMMIPNGVPVTTSPSSTPINDITTDIMMMNGTAYELNWPTVLLALGWGPTPSGLDGWLAALTSPDDGHLTVLILKGAAWVVWGLLAVTILTEAVAALRGLEAPKLPGLRWSQVPARRLVTAALLLFIAVPATGIETASAAPDSPSPVATATASVAPAPSAPVGTPRAVSLDNSRDRRKRFAFPRR